MRELLPSASLASTQEEIQEREEEGRRGKKALESHESGRPLRAGAVWEPGRDKTCVITAEGD